MNGIWGGTQKKRTLRVLRTLEAIPRPFVPVKVDKRVPALPVLARPISPSVKAMMDRIDAKLFQKT